MHNNSNHNTTSNNLGPKSSMGRFTSSNFLKPNKNDFSMAVSKNEIGIQTDSLIQSPSPHDFESFSPDNFTGNTKPRIIVKQCGCQCNCQTVNTQQQQQQQSLRIQNFGQGLKQYQYQQQVQSLQQQHTISDQIGGNPSISNRLSADLAAFVVNGQGSAMNQSYSSSHLSENERGIGQANNQLIINGNDQNKLESAMTLNQQEMQKEDQPIMQQISNPQSYNHVYHQQQPNNNIGNIINNVQSDLDLFDSQIQQQINQHQQLQQQNQHPHISQPQQYQQHLPQYQQQQLQEQEQAGLQSQEHQLQEIRDLRLIVLQRRDDIEKVFAKIKDMEEKMSAFMDEIMDI
eukprot:403365948